jgi:hypothetical protein
MPLIDQLGCAWNLTRKYVRGTQDQNHNFYVYKPKWKISTYANDWHHQSSLVSGSKPKYVSNKTNFE